MDKVKILLAIEDRYTHFISGFTEGAELWFASIIVELKATHPIYDWDSF